MKKILCFVITIVIIGSLACPAFAANPKNASNPPEIVPFSASYDFPSIAPGESALLVSNYLVDPDSTVFVIKSATWNYSTTVKIAFMSRTNGQDYASYITSDGFISNKTFDLSSLPKGKYDLFIHNIGDMSIYNGTMVYDIYG